MLNKIYKFRWILFLLMFFLLDDLFASWLKPYYDAAAAEFYGRYEKIMAYEGDADIVFTGDSHTQHGIDPTLFSQWCDCRAENISMGGGNIITTYYILRSYLKNHKPPKLVVLQTTWQNISTQPNGEHHLLLLTKQGLADQLYYFIKSGDWNFLAKKIIRSYRYRNALPRFIKRDKSITISTISEKGYELLKGNIDEHINYSTELLRQFKSRKATLDKTELLFLDKTIELFDEKETAVVMTQPPEPYEFVTALENYEEMERHLEKKSVEYDIPFYNFDNIADPFLKNKKYFYDEQHLNEDGAIEYSKRLWSLIDKNKK